MVFWMSCTHEHTKIPVSIKYCLIRFLLHPNIYISENRESLLLYVNGTWNCFRNWCSWRTEAYNRFWKFSCTVSRQIKKKNLMKGQENPFRVLIFTKWSRLDGRSPGPTSLLKQGHLELIAQDHVFWKFPDRRFHNPSGQPVPVLYYQQSKEMFPEVPEEPVFHFVLIALCPATGHQWTEPGSILIAPFFQVFIYIDIVPLLSFFFSRLNRSISLSLPSEERQSSLLILSVFFWCYLLGRSDSLKMYLFWKTYSSRDVHRHIYWDYLWIWCDWM